MHAYQGESLPIVATIVDDPVAKSNEVDITNSTFRSNVPMVWVLLYMNLFKRLTQTTPHYINTVGF